MPQCPDAKADCITEYYLLPPPPPPPPPSSSSSSSCPRGEGPTVQSHWGDDGDCGWPLLGTRAGKALSSHAIDSRVPQIKPASSLPHSIPRRSERSCLLVQDSWNLTLPRQQDETSTLPRQHDETSSHNLVITSESSFVVVIPSSWLRESQAMLL